jgi:hypothetical protein
VRTPAISGSSAASRGYVANRTYLKTNGKRVIANMSDWIPTTRDLPFVDDHVLIYCPLLEPDEVTGAARQENGMWACDDGQLLGATEPTHWMPLPAPPTDGK